MDGRASARNRLMHHLARLLACSWQSGRWRKSLSEGPLAPASPGSPTSWKAATLPLPRRPTAPQDEGGGLLWERFPGRGQEGPPGGPGVQLWARRSL